MELHITNGIGTGPTQLAAFDAALYNCGIANYNLLRLSSVIPPQSTVIQHDKGMDGVQMPGTWGDRLYVVMAEQRTEEIGSEVWAGIGWVQDPETHKGLFVEHEGTSEEKVRQDITDSLNALMVTRNIDFSPINMKVIGAKCEDKPTCAMVVAVYQASDWHNQASLLGI
jgi:arginine decarboxylase